MNEVLLVHKIAHFLEGEGYAIKFEVPTMGQSVDIVAQLDTQLTFIEAKISNWRRALAQCKNHTIVADYIYIAISSKRISEELFEEAKAKGFGIIHYEKATDTCYIHLAAKENRSVWHPQRKILDTKIKEISKHGYTALDDVRNIC